MTLALKLETAFAQAHNTLEPAQVDLPRGLHVRVRFLDDGRRQMVAWRDKHLPSETELKVITRDAKFKGVHQEAFGKNKYVLTEFPEEQTEAIGAAQEKRAARASGARGALIERLVNAKLKHHQTPEVSIQAFGDLWREGLAELSDLELERRSKLEVKDWGLM